MQFVSTINLLLDIIESVLVYLWHRLAGALKGLFGVPKKGKALDKAKVTPRKKVKLLTKKSKRPAKRK